MLCGRGDAKLDIVIVIDRFILYYILHYSGLQFPRLVALSRG